MIALVLFLSGNRNVPFITVFPNITHGTDNIAVYKDDRLRDIIILRDIVTDECWIKRYGGSNDMYFEMNVNG